MLTDRLAAFLEHDPELLDVTAISLDVMLSGNALTDRSLGDIAQVRDEELRGVYLRQQRSDSPIAVIGYTAAAPFGHILLTVSGTVIVWLMAQPHRVR